MKNFIKGLFAILLAASLAACDDPNMGGTGDFNLTEKETGPDYAEFYVTAPSAVEMAYLISTEPKAVNAPVLFMTGRTMTVNPKDLIRFDDNLQSNTSYILYAVAKLDESSYSNVIKLEFTTKDYDFDQLLTVVERSYDGFKLHITVPEETKQRGNVIRYSGTSLAMFNVLKNNNMGDETNTILTGVVANGNRHGNYVKNDSTITRNAFTVVVTDENGVPVRDENGEQIDIHNPIAPGEPYVFYAGECAYGTDDEMGAIVGWYYGTHDKSWQVPVFDWSTVDPAFDWDNLERDSWEGSGWTGAFQKIVFNVKEPSLCEETVTIDIPEDEIDVTNAKIYFEMDEGVSRYFYLVLDDVTYNSVVDIYLDKTGAPQEEIDKALQWFLTSYMAFQEWGIGAVTESIIIDAATEFGEGVLHGGETYHVLCTVVVDENVEYVDGEPFGDGAKQRFIHKTFTAKEKTMRAPVIEVTPVAETDPYNAGFNIKAPDGDLSGAYWAANYSKEFQLMLNSGYSYSDIVRSSLQSFNSDEVRQINSAEGLTIYIPTLDGETMRLAVYGCNIEYTFNVIDQNTPGVGWNDYEAPMAPKIAKVESELYEALAGDWTATARIRVNEASGEDVISRETDWSTKVRISPEIPDMPAELPDSVYNIYWNPEEETEASSAAKVNSMFATLQELAARFNEYRLAGRNRLLCTGFLDFDYYKHLDKKRMDYMSPYDLFTYKGYSSVDVPQLINDFGPKWYLQVQPDGSVVVPFSYNYLPPMHAWPGYPFYVGGVGAGGAFYESTDKYPGFPVVISDDYSRITIKPIEVPESEEGGKTVPYYMNALGISDPNSGQMELIYTVISDIVLTRNTSAATAGKKAAPMSAAPAKVRPVTIDGAPVYALPKARIYKAATELKAGHEKQFRVEENPNVLTMDMLNATTEKILRQFNVK